MPVTSESMCTEYWLTTESKLAAEKCVVRTTDGLNMTTAINLNVKPQTKQKFTMGPRTAMAGTCIPGGGQDIPVLTIYLD